MNIFLEALQKLEQSVFVKKKQKEKLDLILKKYSNQQEIIFDIRKTTLVIKTHPLLKQQLLIKKYSILEECKKEGILITVIV